MTNYTDWYANIEGGSTLYYTHSVYNSTTYEYVYVGAGTSSYTYHHHVSGDSSYGGASNHSIENIVEEENILVVIRPDLPIIDVQDFLECFDVTQDAVLTIYVEEPNPGSGQTHQGGFVGHTFISISQGVNTSTYGYYPDETNIYPVINESSIAVLGDDGNGLEHFSASISTTITANQLEQIINHSINHTATYNLNTYNCTDFAIDAGNLGGLNLPASNGVWLGGNGSNPGTLGMYIRSATTTNNTIINTNGGTAPATNKGC
ncbi:hypothetical protein [Ichthyenterobacterium magnum]|uniref:Uncharacterized protein n=1 Tax=Ichthyenterobacterium magnum TaxID=1230530 RepID=A0A420DFY8_9FLAO|nr:hypothetical protein [Ichthyenterobacterium magnum]RKE90999.1 hypothetical protein BXY80_2589 [Ichthyenterobacterium magnum]